MVGGGSLLGAAILAGFAPFLPRGSFGLVPK